MHRNLSSIESLTGAFVGKRLWKCACGEASVDSGELARLDCGFVPFFSFGFLNKNTKTAFKF
jgi:hypothetical protein